MTSFFYNWKFIPFDKPFHPICPPPPASPLPESMATTYLGLKEFVRLKNERLKGRGNRELSSFAAA